jgi:hypothetical protein
VFTLALSHHQFAIISSIVTNAYPSASYAATNSSSAR